MNTPLSAKCRTLGAFAVLLLITTMAQAAPSLVISPSRTSGTGPLYVFFDATGTTNLAGGSNALANADFSWDFDTTNVDPNGTWEQTKGMVAGHVFEAPGTYTVSCTVTGADGTTDTDTVSITVSAFSGTTYYVAANGSNSNAGTEASPWLTAAHALSQLTANERILFRRGDTFPGTTASLSNRTGGPMIVGAYGTGAAPVLNTVISLSNCHDMRFMDLHFAISGGSASVKSEDGSSHILALRLEVEGTSLNALYQDQSDTFGVFDCNLHDVFALGIFSGESTRFSWVGNTLDGLDGTGNSEHGMRVQGGEKQFIAQSVFKHLHNTQTSITIRGDGQRHVMIYNNVLDRIIAVNPTKSTEIQLITDVVLEGNYIGRNEAYEGTDHSPTNVGVTIRATRVAIRNNVIDSYRRNINLAGPVNPAVPVGIIDVYNNTVNWMDYDGDDDDSTGAGGIIVVMNDTFDVTVRNNLISAPTLAQAIITNGSNNTNATVSNNLATTTPGYVVNPLPDPAAHNNSPFNYALLATSPAVDAGGNDVPVFYDLEGLPRPVGSAKDIGAFEFERAYTYLQLVVTATTVQTTGRIAEIDWLVGAAEYPNPHYTGASGDISHTGNVGWEAYDGSLGSTSYWSMDGLPTGTITLQLAGGAIAPTAIRLRPVDANRAPTGFVVRGSTNGTTWIVLKTVTGLTATTWSTAGNDITFSVP